MRWWAWPVLLFGILLGIAFFACLVRLMTPAQIVSEVGSAIKIDGEPTSAMAAGNQ